MKHLFDNLSGVILLKTGDLCNDTLHHGDNAKINQSEMLDVWTCGGGYLIIVAKLLIIDGPF